MERGSIAECWMESSMEMWSVRRFFQCVVLILFLDFQFMRMVFLAIVSAIRINLLLGPIRFIVDVSPSRQRDGDSGMWQPKRCDSDFVTSCQNC